MVGFFNLGFQAFLARMNPMKILLVFIMMLCFLGCATPEEPKQLPEQIYEPSSIKQDLDSDPVQPEPVVKKKAHKKAKKKSKKKHVVK